MIIFCVFEGYNKGKILTFWYSFQKITATEKNEYIVY